MVSNARVSALRLEFEFNERQLQQAKRSIRRMQSDLDNLNRVQAQQPPSLVQRQEPVNAPQRNTTQPQQTHVRRQMRFCVCRMSRAAQTTSSMT